MQHATHAVAHCHIRTWPKLKDMVWAYSCLRNFISFIRRNFGHDQLCYEQYVMTIARGLDKSQEDVLEALRQVRSLDHGMALDVLKSVSN